MKRGLFQVFVSNSIRLWIVAIAIWVPTALCAASLSGTRQTLPRVGLSWIVSNIEVSTPDPLTDGEPALIKAQDLTGYFLRLDGIRNPDGAPRYTRASAEELIRESWNSLKDANTAVSVIAKDKEFVRKDEGQLTVDRLSIKITRDNRTFQGLAYIIQRADVLVVAVFVTEVRTTVIDNMIQSLESAEIQ